MIDIETGEIIPYLSASGKGDTEDKFSAEVEDKSEGREDTPGLSKSDIGAIGDVAGIMGKLSGVSSEMPAGSFNTGINAVEGLASGKDLGTVAANAAIGTAYGIGVSELADHLGGYGSLAGTIGTGVMGLATGKDPSQIGANMTASALGTLASVAGFAVNPIVGLVAGTSGRKMAQESVKDGWIGDVFDVRAFEEERDFLEDMKGYSRSETEDAADFEDKRDILGMEDLGVYTSDSGKEYEVTPGITDLADDPYNINNDRYNQPSITGPEVPGKTGILDVYGYPEEDQGLGGDSDSGNGGVGEGVSGMDSGGFGGGESSDTEGLA